MVPNARLTNGTSVARGEYRVQNSGETSGVSRAAASKRPSRCLRASGRLVCIQLMLGGHCSAMQINPLLLKSFLFCSGVTAKFQAAETPAVVKEALEQQTLMEEWEGAGISLYILLNEEGALCGGLGSWECWRSDVENMLCEEWIY